MVGGRSGSIAPMTTPRSLLTTAAIALLALAPAAAAQTTQRAPIKAAIIDLDGTQGAGCRLIANIVDCDPESVRIGDKVQIEGLP